MGEERRNRLIPDRQRALLTRHRAERLDAARILRERRYLGLNTSVSTSWGKPDRSVLRGQPAHPDKNDPRVRLPRRYGFSSTERVMWWPGEPKKIFAYGEPIDMRCSFDGLVAAVKAHPGADPLTGDFNVFVSRRRTLWTEVFWGPTGWCVFAKRLQAAGIKLSRQTLTDLVARSVSLLELVYYAQFSSVLSSKVLAMDETLIKAGRKSPGKLNQGYYWALYGDKDEVSFEYSPTRAFSVVGDILGSFWGVLIADGYGAYDRYAQEEEDVVMAQCWAHTRRNFVEAEGAEREACGQALDFIGELYRHKDIIRKKGLSGEAKLAYRAEYLKPVVEAFRVWFAKKFTEWSILTPESLR